MGHGADPLCSWLRLGVTGLLLGVPASPEMHGGGVSPHFRAGVDLHFWDSPDDILGASMDLVLERHGRMYMHGASGRFGAVPLSVAGDMGLNPDTGTYRCGQGHWWYLWLSGAQPEMRVRCRRCRECGASRAWSQPPGP